METIIKVSPGELDIDLLNRIKDFIGNSKNIDVTISLKEMDAGYVDALNNSIQQTEDKLSMISFTMEEFMTYSPNK